MSTVSSTPAINPYLVAYSSSDISGTDSTAGKYTASSSSNKSGSSSSGSYSQGLIGQMTGLDVNSMVNESMQSDVIKLNSLLAKQQVSQWQQDRYRSVITNLQNFSSKYFDVLSDDYMLSSGRYSVYTASSDKSMIATATASNNVKPGTYTITSVATAAQLTNSTTFTDITKDSALSTLLDASHENIAQSTISFKVNGTTVSYDLSAAVAANKTVGQAMSDLSALAGNATFSCDGSGKFSITDNVAGASNYLKIEAIDGTSGNSNSEKFLNNIFGTGFSDTTVTTQYIGKSGDSNNVAASVSGTDSNTIATAAKIVGSNTVSTQNSAEFSTVGAWFSGTLKFNINGKDLTYDLSSDANKTKTVSQVMNDLSSLTGSNFSYSELSKKFSVSSSSTGSAQQLNIHNSSGTSASTSDIYVSDANTQNFMTNLLGIANGSSASASGSDAKFTITEPDGTTSTVTESSNNFTIDGLTYNATSAGTTTINVSMDVSSAVNKIQSFVADYNNLIDGINTVVTEKRNYDYKPLSSSQESQMTASQIIAWNQKSQQGLLGNDGDLSDILSTMRSAFYTPVNGNNLTMASVGLSTSNDPTQGGKITLDVKTLTTALQNNPQQVVDLFTHTSSTYTTYEDALNADTSTDSNAVSKAVNQRNQEEGIFQRLSDIEKRYAGTYIDKQGNQGILLMKAGMPDTISETKSELYKELKDEATAVSDFKTKITSDEKMYNQKFTALQSILTQLSSQQSALSSMLGTSSS